MRGARAIPWLAVGALVALMAGAGALSVLTAPSQLDVARSTLPANNPAALVTLFNAIDRTLAVTSLTATIRFKGAPPDQIIYQAPNRVEGFASTSVTMVEIGSTIYTKLPAGFTTLPNGTSCSGWVASTLPRHSAALFGREEIGLTMFPNAPTNVQKITPSRFQAESVYATHLPKWLASSPSIVMLVTTIEVSHGLVVAEKWSATGPKPFGNQRADVQYSEFNSSPPVTAPPAKDICPSLPAAFHSTITTNGPGS